MIEEEWKVYIHDFPIKHPESNRLITIVGRSTPLGALCARVWETYSDVMDVVHMLGIVISI